MGNEWEIQFNVETFKGCAYILTYFRNFIHIEKLQRKLQRILIQSRLSLPTVNTGHELVLVYIIQMAKSFNIYAQAHIKKYTLKNFWPNIVYLI